MDARLLAHCPQAMTKGLSADRDRHRQGSMRMFHLYWGGRATLISFVWVSEDAGHVIEDGIEEKCRNQ
jgi:hypothetical protein